MNAPGHPSLKDEVLPLDIAEGPQALQERPGEGMDTVHLPHLLRPDSDRCGEGGHTTDYEGPPVRGEGQRPRFDTALTGDWLEHDSRES